MGQICSYCGSQEEVQKSTPFLIVSSLKDKRTSQNVPVLDDDRSPPQCSGSNNNDGGSGSPSEKNVHVNDSKAAADADSDAPKKRTARVSYLCIPHPQQNTSLHTIDTPNDDDNNNTDKSSSNRQSRMSSLSKIPNIDAIKEHCEIEYCEEGCKITPDRLKEARIRYSCMNTNKACQLTESEVSNLSYEQKTIRSSLFGGSIAEGEVHDWDSPQDWHPDSGIDTIEEDGDSTEYEEEKDEEEDDNNNKLGTINAQLIKAKLRARVDDTNSGVLGVQDERKYNRYNSILGDKFVMYNMRQRASIRGNNTIIPEDYDTDDKEEEEKKQDIDLEDISYVRKPNMARIIQEYEQLQNHPKYTLKQVVLSRRFHLYRSRFANAQFQKTLYYPTLKQPKEMMDPTLFCQPCSSAEETGVITEKTRTRPRGHRFIITADTQYGILMDGFAMEYPNWSTEIEISRKCVEQINNMKGDERPLFVSVCGDLVDTESSFSGAIASWKKVMSGWERNLVFDQQVKDFKRVWAGLDSDIALISVSTAEIASNFNVSSHLQWMEDRLAYAVANNATHIFVYGHFPWFLKHEEEADDYLTSYSLAPDGWGPNCELTKQLSLLCKWHPPHTCVSFFHITASKFADSYFTVPYEQRKLAMALFKKYNVTACFSGHFHQNVVAQSSWGMPMIVTGPLSMTLQSEISHELSSETNGIGMRIVDVGEKGEFTHKWTLLDEEEVLYDHAIERCLRCSEKNEESKQGFDDPIPKGNSLFDVDYSANGPSADGSDEPIPQRNSFIKEEYSLGE
eukprot:scaffold1229_cov49-Cyclotella_meneghiniana.AAC.2